MAAIRRHADRVDVFEVEHVAAVLAVQADGDQLLRQPAAGQEEHPGAVGVELRLASIVADLPRLAAGGRAQEQAGVATEGAAHDRVPALADVDDLRAVRREARAVVEARLRRQFALGAGGEVAHHDAAAAGIGPGGEDQLAAVGRETGLVLEAVVAPGQRHRRCVAVAQPEPADGMEHHAAPVGRRGDVARHLRRERALGQALGLARRLGDDLLDLGGERDVRCFARGGVNAPELAVLAPHDQRGVVRRPVEVGVGPEDRPSLLLVAGEAVPERAHLAAGEVEQVQHALVADALHEREGLAVRRGLRTHGAARTGDQRLDLAGLAVEALDGVDQAVRVLVVFEGGSAADVLGEVDVAAVRRDRGFAEVLLVVLHLGELQAVAAVAMHHPELAGAQRSQAGEVLAADQVLAVRRPRRVVEQAEALLRHLRGAAAVGAHAPQVVAAVAVRGVGDLAAVGRVARLHVPGRARGQTRGPAAVDRQAVEVAEHREHDAAPVRRDVEVQPRALIGGETHRLRRAVLPVDVPGRGVGGAGGRAQGGGGSQRGGKQGRSHRGIPGKAREA